MVSEGLRANSRRAGRAGKNLFKAPLFCRVKPTVGVNTLSESDSHTVDILLLTAAPWNKGVKFQEKNQTLFYTLHSGRITDPEKACNKLYQLGVR